MRLVHFAASVLLLDRASAALFSVGPIDQQVLLADAATGPKEHPERSPWNVTAGDFEQWLDHKNQSAGTFQQRYFWSADYYGGPGYPIIFINPPNGKAEDYIPYVSNLTITGNYAKAVKGAVVLLEHRYFGGSSPFKILSTANLTYLTLDNELADIAYFASKVQFPFDLDRKSAPDMAPWVFYGCSFSGNYPAWMSALSPDTFWAYHAASAAVEAVTDWWQYFESVRRVMPKNCSTDAVKVIDYVDKVLYTGTDFEGRVLKNMLLAGDLPADDFAELFMSGPYQLEGQNFVQTSRFYEFCDYVENVWPGSNSSVPGPEGVGLDKALVGYVKWINDRVTPGACSTYGFPEFNGPNNVNCFNTHDKKSPLYTDLSVSSVANRQNAWYRCNYPYEGWRTAAPAGSPSLVSRLINVEYYRRQCAFLFPETDDGKTYGIANGKSAADLNKVTGGWNNTNAKRVLWSFGENDPARSASVTSDWRPGGPRASTKDQPIVIVPDASRCNDARWVDGDANPAVRAAQDAEIAIVKGWVDEYYHSKGITLGGN